MKTIKITVILLMITLFTSCSKDDETIDAPPTPTVHTVGFTIGSVFQSNYWKNNTFAANVFDPTINTTINQIIIDNGNVYTTGSISFGTASKACYAKNGVVSNLTNGDFFAESNCIFVANNIIYTAGFENNSTGINVAKYWINGVPTVVTNGSSNALIKSIYVSGDDVYCAGHENNSSGFSVAKIWRNGTLLYTLGNGIKSSRCNSIIVKDGIVYSCGYQINSANKTVAVLWKNNIATNLTSGSVDATASALVLNNSKIYTAFDEVNNPTGKTGKYYTYDITTDSGATTVLPSASTSSVNVKSIFVYNNDIYVAGDITDGSMETLNGIYWKNQEPFRLNMPRTGFSSIYVTN